MKTAIDWDTLRNKFGKKKSILAVYTKDRTRKLGEADFDLGKYANDPENTRDQLPLRNCESDPKAFIQIQIKSKMLDSGESTPKRGSSSLNTSGELNRSIVQYTQNLKLQAIEEKASELDVKEEIERQTSQYQK